MITAAKFVGLGMNAIPERTPEQLPLRLEYQLNQVQDEVSAITAVVRPILLSTLYALKQEAVADAGGYEQIKLRQLARVYRAGDGDCGLSFEYAVHDALERNDPVVTQKVADALTNHVRMNGLQTSSILFGAEKTGALQIIDTAKDRLTDDSILLHGSKGRPAKLRRHIDSIAAAFRKSQVREQLPWSINGLWKADLFVGYSDSDRWVGTTVKVNKAMLEGARGLRIGIVPARSGDTDLIQRDENKNLIVCPLPYDGSFMQVFYQGWNVVKQVLAYDAELPPEAAIQRGPERIVAGYLVDRRDHSVLDLLDVMQNVSQPQLLRTQAQVADISTRGAAQSLTAGAVVSPVARLVDD